jgi:uncharacterized DUF497 family protein
LARPSSALGDAPQTVVHRAAFPLDVYLFGTFFIPVKFEYDPSKSSRNKAKHGIDFVAAQALWNDGSRLEIEAESLDEPRFQVLGLIGNKVWSAFITYRTETVRIISVRRARENEEQLYYDR